MYALLLLLISAWQWYYGIQYLRPERAQIDYQREIQQLIEASWPQSKQDASHMALCRLVMISQAIKEDAHFISDCFRKQVGDELDENWWIYADDVDQPWFPSPCDEDDDYSYRRYLFTVAAARQHIESVAHQGIIDEIILISREKVLYPGVCDVAPLGESGRHQLGITAIRMCVTLLLSDAYLAHERGDDQHFVELIAASLRLVRLCDADAGLIQRISATSMLNRTIDRITAAIVRRPLKHDAMQILARELEMPVLERQWSDIFHTLTLELPLSAQQLYTSYSRGGVLVWVKYEEAPFGNDIRQSLFGDVWMIGSDSMKNAVACFCFPRRATYERRWREYYETVGAWADLAILERRQSDKVEHFVSKLELGLPQLRTLKRPFERAIGEADAARCRYDGVRLLVAVERFCAAHRGQPPRSLDELVPDYLSNIPADHFAANAEFRYHPTPLRNHSSDPPYILYSVGFDGVDNNGHVESSYVNDDMLKSDRFGEGDYVINSYTPR